MLLFFLTYGKKVAIPSLNNVIINKIVANLIGVLKILNLNTPTIEPLKITMKYIINNTVNTIVIYFGQQGDPGQGHI